MGWFFGNDKKDDKAKASKPEPAPPAAAPAPKEPPVIRKPNAVLASKRKLREIFEQEIDFVVNNHPEVVNGFCTYPNGSYMSDNAKSTVVLIIRQSLVDAAEAVARQTAPIARMGKPELLETAMAQAMFVQLAAPAFAIISAKLAEKYIAPQDKASYLDCEILFKNMLSGGFSNSLAGVSGFFRVIARRMGFRIDEMLAAYEHLREASVNASQNKQ